MRKQLKNKLRCCGLCKPHKRGWTTRWKRREEVLRKELDREVQEANKPTLVGYCPICGDYYNKDFKYCPHIGSEKHTMRES